MGGSVSFPLTDALGNSIPDDARYEFSVFDLYSGTGGGQRLLTSVKIGTRKFAYVLPMTPAG